MATVSMKIGGMTCGHCVAAVKKALESVGGATVELVTVGSAQVRFDEAATSINALERAVEDEGYSILFTH